MKVNISLVCGLLSFAWAIAPALAQIDINAGDGSQVKIGPGGVFVKSGGNVVKVRPTNVKIDQAIDGGASQVEVGPGGVSIKSGGSVVHHNGHVKSAHGESRAAAGASAKHGAGWTKTVDQSSLKAAVQVNARAMDQASVKPVVQLNSNTLDRSSTKPVSTSAAVKFQNYAITSNNSEVSFTCNGDSCTIGSNNNTVTLRGNCSKLSIVGNNNEVICETVAAVSITGSNNTVTWKAGSRPPTLLVTGNNNETSEASVSR